MSNSTQSNEINALIARRLADYPDDIRELATRAIQLSEDYPEQAVAEQLQSIVRQLILKQSGDEQ